jgi:hypothetical protein
VGNVSEKTRKGNQNTNFVFNNFFLEKRAVCDIMWKNIVEWSRAQMAIQYGACTLHAG